MMTEGSLQELLRRIPAVDQLLLRPRFRDWCSRTSRSFVVGEIQKYLQELRQALRSGGARPDVVLDPEAIESVLEDRLRVRLQSALGVVINATGVILHTNLGRAPLSKEAQESLSAVSARYTNLEYNLTTGDRTLRDLLLEPLLRDVLGCESATVVNNNAAAVFLILNTLALGREVLVSRGELIEIGGSFRIPEILARSGALLREVGTTNKTRIEDYESAIGPNTALLLRVHTSNFRIRGFAEKPALREMVTFAERHRLPLVDDIGSGCLVDLSPYGIGDEPVAQESVRAGVDLVCFSADKLLGGPQAGIIVGARKWIEPIRSNPLMRTYRVGKLVLAALEATLASYRTGSALEEIPVLSLISTPQQEVRARARRFMRRIKDRLPRDVRIQVIEGNSVIGGGSCPESLLPTALVALESSCLSPNVIEARLRSQAPPIIVRVEADRILLDLRTVFPAQEKFLLDGLSRALAEPAAGSGSEVPSA